MNKTQTRWFDIDLNFSSRFSEFEDDSGSNHHKEDSNGTSSKSTNNLAMQLFQQNIPSHLLIVALLEHICSLYDPKQHYSRELFKVLCSQLSTMKLIPPFAILDEFQSIRDKYRLALDDLLGFAIGTIQKNKAQTINRPLRWKDSFDGITPNLTSHVIHSPSRYKEEFEEIEMLGEGGFGSVFEARNKLDGKRYAIKKIKLANIHPDECLKVLREVKVLANLENANVVRYYSAWLEYSITESQMKALNKNYQQSKSSGKQSISRPTKSAEISKSFNGCLFSTATKTRSNSFFGNSPTVSFGTKEEIAEEMLKDWCHCNDDNASSIQGHFSDFSSFQTNEEIKSKNEIVMERAISLDFNRFRHGSNAICQNVLTGEKYNAIEIEMNIQMELCSSTLKQWITDRNDDMYNFGTEIEKSVNMNIFKQILLGVNYIHYKGLMHRDLKPCNIFLINQNDSGEILVKIGDFGLARAVQRNFNHLQASSRANIFPDYSGKLADDFATKGVGTCVYAAPEQILTNSYSYKADIYSLGIILFELFLPFKTGMERHVLIKELRNSCLPESFITTWPEISSLIRQMTNADPNTRPSTSSLLDLQHFQDKDKIIELLRSELAERAKQIRVLKERLQEKEMEIEKLKQQITTL